MQNILLIRKWLHFCAIVDKFFSFITYFCVLTINEKVLHANRAIKSNFWINHYNAIYEHNSIFKTVWKICVFIDGAVVVTEIYTFYCFNDINVFFITYRAPLRFWGFSYPEKAIWATFSFFRKTMKFLFPFEKSNELLLPIWEKQ